MPVIRPDSGKGDFIIGNCEWSKVGLTGHAALSFDWKSLDELTSDELMTVLHMKGFKFNFEGRLSRVKEDPRLFVEFFEKEFEGNTDGYEDVHFVEMESPSFIPKNIFFSMLRSLTSTWMKVDVVSARDWKMQECFNGEDEVPTPGLFPYPDNFADIMAGPGTLVLQSNADLPPDAPVGGETGAD